MARSIALLTITAPASGHFVWLSANGHGEAVAEFNEPGRLTDPHLLGKLYNMTRGQVHTMEGTTSDLHFMTRGAGDGYHCAAEVYAPLPQQGSMAVEAQATYGLYAVGTDEGGTGEKDLLQYWATAVHAHGHALLLLAVFGVPGRGRRFRVGRAAHGAGVSFDVLAPRRRAF